MSYINKKFGELTIKEEIDGERKKCVFLKCLCSCGNEKIIKRYEIDNGNSVSCGCRQQTKGLFDAHKANTKHGQTSYFRKNKKASKTYNIWASAKARCENKKNFSYKNYGGRGIKMSLDWSDSFIKFYEDMGECPEGFSLERKNVDGDYSKENCIWIPLVNQQKNKRTNIYLTYKNETMILADWAKRLNVSRQCLRLRYHGGWTHEQIIETPSNRGNGKLNFNKI